MDSLVIISDIFIFVGTIKSHLIFLDKPSDDCPSEKFVNDKYHNSLCEREYIYLLPAIT